MGKIGNTNNSKSYWWIWPQFEQGRPLLGPEVAYKFQIDRLRDAACSWAESCFMRQANIQYNAAAVWFKKIVFWSGLYCTCTLSDPKLGQISKLGQVAPLSPIKFEIEIFTGSGI
jgi:hypothetical protein